MRADAATDLGEGVGRLTDLIGFLQTPFGGQLQPIGNIVVQRTMLLTIRHAALAAAARLFSGLFARVFTVYLVEISLAQRRWTLLGHFFRQRDEFQHGLLGHETSPILAATPIPIARKDKKTVLLTYLKILLLRRHKAPLKYRHISKQTDLSDI